MTAKKPRDDNYPYTDLWRYLPAVPWKAWPKWRPACFARRSHFAPARKSVKYGQKTAANAAPQHSKGIKVYSQLAVRLPAT